MMPQNNEVFDYNPEYAKLYQGNGSPQSDADNTDDWTQHASKQPSDEQRAQDGKKAANVSLLFGALGLLFFFLGCWLFVHDFDSGGLQIVVVAPLLNVLGIWQGRVAKQHGVPALAGRILSWAGVIFALPFAIIVALFLIVLTGGI
ncbi:hypothetical protein ACLUU9_00990 [Rothia mucilaginosa]|jgi:hypothetical protein|nr:MULTISPECIES: hypothetical protein [Rothia]OFJ73917.1 hypothetical protein HMPREF2845_01040 [Rothia sp. HMSC065B04]MDU2571047.1 hypothetical protein [Rothia mucilaginosa]OFL51016.1 hypothetical protein HMPREF2765_02365 [Rothia sp. HMSC062H08]OFP75977.1 hypothetical protein HMPREF2971_03170 [Rothia sp. HMSC066G07]OFQ76101.1 hypothetical protein HMPREF2919_01415 [Rothia sp. HMSC068E02]